MRRSISFIQTVWRGVEYISTKAIFIAGLFVILMTIAILREVVGRYFFDAPSDWSLELSCYLLVGLTYLGAAYTELSGYNIRIDFLYQRFRGKAKHLVDMLIHLVGLTWSAMLVWQGFMLAMHSWKIDAHSSQAMGWPLFPSQILVPIGSMLLCFIFIGKLIKSIHSLKHNPQGH